jgi:hypothetical protein
MTGPITAGRDTVSDWRALRTPSAWATVEETSAEDLFLRV